MAVPSPRRAHIAVFNVPQQGHVFPTLAVVSELVARGHRVSYAVTEEFAGAVKACGAEPVVHHPGGTGQEAPEDLAAGVTTAIGQTIGALPELAAAFAEDRPDLVLYDMYAWSGPLLAARWQVPAVQLAPTHLPYDGIVPELLGVPDITHIPGFTELSDALAAHGVTESVHELTLAPRRAVAFFPRAFQRKADTVTAGSVAYVGPALGDRSHQGRWCPPTGDRPVLLISLGSQYNRRPDFYRACVDAFAATEWHVVMSIGGAVDPSALGSLPATVEVHAGVPQLEVLAHARAFITHAGMGSVMEALSHGVPLVAVPQMAEQHANAHLVEHLRLGVRLPREQATAHALLDAVRRVTADAGIARGVAALRHEITEAGGARAAADFIEQSLPAHRATAG
ncbi:macrolide family glycosyltransferase [Streptomyces sp. SP18CS02]|uniref:macrolide family glycosyltransferase n=1 Tax=Streptomyces sp. SP18CS02 TaxID=3002531 RepID=UPI002E7A8EE3|nr:macrolide family glycosyltransferase [Streptomyces sp. SP18CS02]MEE1754055.1 glycosyltransferase [Streptomyces sp. SP18CS02]